jgi:hypothetical protein
MQPMDDYAYIQEASSFFLWDGVLKKNYSCVPIMFPDYSQDVPPGYK